MNVLILGNGEQELAWARWLLGQREHRLDAAYPGFGEAGLTHVAAPRDLDDALARAGIDVVIVGGPIDVRGEYLRRGAAEGLAIICLHPPGTDSEAYYQVALSRNETGAVIVPDLPLRLHPGVALLREAMSKGELGAFRAIRLETCSGDSDSLARSAFPRYVDVVRSLLGEIEALTATGDPPGEDPDLELIVQLRAEGAHRAELRIWSGPAEPARLALMGSSATLILNYDPRFDQPGKLIRRWSGRPDQVSELAAWDAHDAVFSVLEASLKRRGETELPSPNLHDGTRAMELSEATVRSLRRGRTVEMHYEAISEDATFKSVMTSTGCLIFIASLIALPLAMAGPPLGMNWTLFIPYIIPPILVIFVVMQTLRLGVRRHPAGDMMPGDDARETPAAGPGQPQALEAHELDSKHLG
jgi:myo-inositol 2-dehydrogenase/D-chiro-inositol 1-dehydrogenase